MKILLFGGTTEGREIAASGLPVVYSVTTDYGAELADSINVEPVVGRMDADVITAFLKSRPIAGVIDATHPYASEVSQNARAACERTGIPYVRVVRDTVKPDNKDIIEVASCKKAAEILNEPSLSEAGVLLTVGSKELACFTSVKNYRKRLFARVLPKSEMLLECEKLGFDAGHIIAMKGPFTKAMNAAILEMTNARVLVTKDGGKAGGFEEKLAAAKELGVDVLSIRRPEETGITAAEAIDWGFGLLGKYHETQPHTLPIGRLQASVVSCADRLDSSHMDRGPLEFPFFPLFTNITGRRAVVVGGGKVAARRAKTLLTCGAQVTVISPSFDPSLDEPGLEGVKRLPLLYRKGCMEGIALVVAATDDRNVNRDVGLEAKKLGIPVSVADAPEECTFLFPSLVERDGVVAAISTGGRSPSLCRRLASRLRAVWPDWVDEETGKNRKP